MCIFSEYGAGFLYFGCQDGELVVRFRRLRGAMRRFPCVIQVIASLFAAKMWCGNGKNVCDFCGLAAYTSVSMCYSGDFQLVFGCSEAYNGGFLSDDGEMVVLCGGCMVRKWRFAI